MALLTVDTIGAVDEAAKVLEPPIIAEFEKFLALLPTLFDGYEITISITKKGPQ